MLNEKLDVVKHNAVILANAVAVASSIVIAVGDKDSALTINGESLTRDRIEQVVAARITNELLNNG